MPGDIDWWWTEIRIVRLQHFQEGTLISTLFPHVIVAGAWAEHWPANSVKNIQRIAFPNAHRCTVAFKVIVRSFY